MDENNNPSPIIRLPPLFSGASFDTLRQVAILVSTPLGLVLPLMVFGLLRRMKEDRKKAGMLLPVKDDMDKMIRLSRVEAPEDDASSPPDPAAQITSRRFSLPPQNTPSRENRQTAVFPAFPTDTFSFSFWKFHTISWIFQFSVKFVSVFTIAFPQIPVVICCFLCYHV